MAFVADNAERLRRSLNASTSGAEVQAAWNVSEHGNMTVEQVAEEEANVKYAVRHCASALSLSASALPPPTPRPDPPIALYLGSQTLEPHAATHPRVLFCWTGAHILRRPGGDARCTDRPVLVEEETQTVLRARDPARPLAGAQPLCIWVSG